MGTMSISLTGTQEAWRPYSTFTESANFIGDKNIIYNGNNNDDDWEDDDDDD